MKYFKAFVFLISFLFSVAGARDLAKAKTFAEAKTIPIPGLTDTNLIGTGGGFPGVIGGRQYYGGFRGFGYPGFSIPGIIGDFLGGVVGGFQGVGGFPSGGGVGNFPGYCQYGCCQYSGYSCLTCC